MEYPSPRNGRLLIVLAATIPTVTIPTVHVLVEREKQAIHIAGYDLVVKQDQKTLIHVDQQASISFRCTSGEKIEMTWGRVHHFKKNKILATAPVQVESLGGFLRMDHPQTAAQAKYRGELYVYSMDGNCLIVNHVDLEKYVAGLLDSEMSARWNMQALMAQAIAARTYAIYQMKINETTEMPFDLDSSVKDQVYEGASREKYRALQAAQATRGLILTYQGQPIKAFYHSTCGGYTEEPQKVWGHRYPYIHSVKCGFCKTSPRFSWSYILPSLQLEKTLQTHGLVRGHLLSLGVLRKNSDNRVDAIEIQSEMRTVLAANRFRELLGSVHIRSTDFKILPTRGGFLFTGHGLGHGVGLCQWGAKTMGEQGYRYSEILRHYYPGVEISKLYE